MQGIDFQLSLTTDKVAQTESSAVLLVAPQDTAREVIERMRQEGRSAALVCRSEVLVGMFTERDALRLLARNADLDLPIEQVMVWPVVSLSQGDTVDKAIAKMAHGGYRRLPVVDDEGKPTGLVKAAAILHYLVQQFPRVVYTLPPSPHYTYQERDGA